MVLSVDVKTYACCSAALYFKFWATSLVQAKSSFDTGNRAPEDTKSHGLKQTFGNDQSRSKEEIKQIEKAKEKEQRWRRIVQNDLESIPFALAIFAGGLLAKSNPSTSAYLMIAYTAARYGFTVSYAYGLQPHRGICYMTGVLCIVGSAVNTVLTVLK